METEEENRQKQVNARPVILNKKQLQFNILDKRKHSENTSQSHVLTWGEVLNQAGPSCHLVENISWNLTVHVEHRL